MEDSSVALVNKTDTTLPLGMSSFGTKERQQFGQDIRLAMACMEGSAAPVIAKAIPTDETAIHHRLKVLSQDIASYHADLLELLVRFDDMEGWKKQGASHCAAWVNLELGISLQLGWEYLRVGRKLRLLPTATALFRAGKLSWSKIRLLASVADEDNEKILCHAALDASVTDVKRLCNEYRWAEDETDYTVSQRRADAAVLMAESNLQAAGREFATADRYQVIVCVDSAELATPSKRASIKGSGPIARETARRIACDCSVTTLHKTNGEPTDIGRRSRLWPAAMARAIKDRDQHCQFPGCNQLKNLQIHHIEHWADGGKTCVENGVCLCQYHHTTVHEGGYSIEAVAGNERLLGKQFSAQCHADDIGMFSAEEGLRNDEVSFNKVRGLLPTRYRFCVLDSEGRDLNDRRVSVNDTNHIHSIRVEWGEREPIYSGM